MFKKIAPQSSSLMLKNIIIMATIIIRRRIRRSVECTIDVYAIGNQRRINIRVWAEGKHHRKIDELTEDYSYPRNIGPPVALDINRGL